MKEILLKTSCLNKQAPAGFLFLILQNLSQWLLSLEYDYDFEEHNDLYYGKSGVIQELNQTSGVRKGH